MLAEKTNHKSIFREYLAVCILLIILVIGFMWQVFFLGEALLPADLVNTSVHPWVLSEQNQYDPAERPHNPTLSDPIFIYYPMKHYLASSFSEGVQPLWNPSSFCGYPYNSRVVSEMYAPLDFPYLFAPPVYAFGLSVAFHLFIAGLFMYILCKSLKISKLGSFFAAVVFMFNANTVLWLEFPTHLKGELWIPMVFLFLIRFYQERRWVFSIMCGIIFGIQILSGFTQAAQFTVIAIAIILAIYIIYDIKDKKYSDILRKIGGTALVGVIALGIGISLLLPLYREISGSLRDAQARGGGGRINFKYLATMLNPNFFGDGVRGAFWLPGTNYIESVRYSGVATLFLAAIAAVFKKGKAVFSILAVAVIAVLLNSVPQIFNFFNMIIPLFDKSSISRILLLIPICLAVLSGFGLSYLQEQKFENNHAGRKKVIIFIVVLAAAFMLIMAVMAIGFDAHISIRDIRQNQQIRLETISMAIFAVMSIASVVFIILAIKTGRKKIFLALLVPLLVLDLFVFGINYNTTSSPDQIFFETESIQYIKQDKEQSRVLGVMGGTFNPNSLWIFGLEDTGGYDPVIPYDYAQFWAAFQGKDRVRPNGKVGADLMYDNFLNLTNTRYVTSYAYMQEMGYFFNNMDQNLNQQSREQSTLATWNFMEHIVPTIEVEPDSVMEFEYHIPASSELVFYNAMHPGRWDAETGNGVIYRVYVQAGESRDLVFEQDLNPIQDEEDRRWYMHRLDLSQYGDMAARIIFQTDSKQDSENDRPGWGNPRILPKDSLGYENLALAYNKEVKIYNNQTCLPRAFLAANSMILESEEQVLACLANNHNLDLENTVLLTGEPKGIEGETGGSAEIAYYSNNRVKIETDSKNPAYLVLLDRYDADWNVYVDGRKEEMLKANYLFRAVYVEPGRHTVEFRYQPVWFYAALWISLFALIISVSACIVIYKLEKKGNYVSH